MGIEASRITSPIQSMEQLTKELDNENLPNFLVNSKMDVVQVNEAFLSKFELEGKSFIVGKSIDSVIPQKQVNGMESRRMIINLLKDWSQGDVNDSSDKQEKVVPVNDTKVRSDSNNSEAESVILDETGFEELDSVLRNMRDCILATKSCTETNKINACKCLSNIPLEFERTAKLYEIKHSENSSMITSESNEFKKVNNLFNKSLKNQLNTLDSLKQQTQEKFSKHREERRDVRNIKNDGEEIMQSIEECISLYTNLINSFTRKNNLK